jgi:hypothetical protein
MHWDFHHQCILYVELPLHPTNWSRVSTGYLRLHPTRAHDGVEGCLLR